VSTPNSMLCLTLVSFTSIDKFVSRVKSLVLVIYVQWALDLHDQCFVSTIILVICLTLVCDVI
jgi:hypothetical protein